MASTWRKRPRPRGRIVGLLAILLLVLLPGVAIGVPSPPDPGECEYGDADLSTEFTDIRRDLDINVGPDLGDGGHLAMNFTGSTGSAGDLWMSQYTGGAGYSAVRLCADVLAKPFNNRKGAGVFFLYSGGNGLASVSSLGLAAIVTNAGNTDTLILGIANQTNGNFTALAGGSYPLGAAIAEKAWYRLRVEAITYSGPSLSVDLQVFRHVDPSDPDSALGTQVGPTFTWDGPLPTGIATSGAVGLAAYAKLAVVDSSATHFNRDTIYLP